MDRELFKAIVAIQMQGENVKVSPAKQKAYAELVVTTIEALDLAAEQLFSEDAAIRKEAASTLKRKTLMDLMRSDAEIVRGWFIDKSNREKIAWAIEQERDESIRSTLLSTVGFACERFSYSSLLSWPLSIDYLKFSCDLLNRYLDSESETVRFAAALALTQFRLPKVWDVLYDFTGKRNSKTYTQIANRLFNFGPNRLKFMDIKDRGKGLQILDALHINYSKEGLTQEQLVKYRAVLESAYQQKVTAETKSAIVNALQSIGDKGTIVFLTAAAKEEQDEYEKAQIVDTIKTLREWLNEC